MVRSRLVAARRRRLKGSQREEQTPTENRDLLEPFGERPPRMEEERDARNKADHVRVTKPVPPSLEPYVTKLERFELFSTNQCYYLVACDKHNHAYRVLKMDRTLIERPPEEVYERDVQPQHQPQQQQADSVASKASHAQSEISGATTNATNTAAAAAMEASHNPKPTLRPLSDFLTEDPHTYSQDEIQDMLDMIHHGNRLMRQDGAGGESAGNNGGGLKPITKAYGIVGFIRFLDCYYLTLITKRIKVGDIGGNGIYTIKSTETFPLKPADRGPGEAYGDDLQSTDPSAMLLNMWNRGKRSVGLGLTNREIAELRYQGLYQVVDLHKNFYFSYTYDLTRSLQENFLATVSQPFPPPPFKDMYAWNFFLTRELDECTNSLTNYHWIMPIIHGAYVQRRINDYGRSLDLILLARRSRHFAGTRYLKRGVSDRGKVANDVEHEQIVHDESSGPSQGSFSSFLQVRGSIPTFWTQESSVTMPKPPIELNRVDPTYHATQAHFEDLLQRYGGPIVVLDLVKQSEKREREVRVGNEFRHAIDYINTNIDDAHKVRYCALDYSHISKHRHLDVSTSLNEVSTWAVNQTGFFCSAPRWKIMQGGRVEPFDQENMRDAALLSQHLGVPVFPMEQRGVLRTNCIDCLDRTNVAQFSAGVEALEQQLVVMGIRSSATLDPSSNIIRVLIDMYVEIGDHIALQYGGSEAHKKVSAERSDSNIHGPMGKHKELLTSIRRYYSNAFTDRLKQDAMNLFLGYYIPYRHKIPLWDLESDYYLHNFHVKAGRGTFHSMKTHQRAFGVDWNDNEDEKTENEEEKRNRESLLVMASNHQNHLTRRPLQLSAGDETKAGGESLRIEKVRKRCNAQNEALSVWWKVAIQANFQQRMWMQLGRSPSESMLPPRFERMYQPDKLDQFDRFFARGWSTPSRQTHAAQHSPDAGDEYEIGEYRRTISERVGHRLERHETHGRKDTEETESGTSDEDQTLTEYVSEYGFQPQVPPSLKKFIKPHESRGQGPTLSRSVSPTPNLGGETVAGNADKGDMTLPYIGNLVRDAAPCDEYLRYASSTSDSISKPYRRKAALMEFSRCLHDTALSHDDVDGIRKLSESAHIGRTIKSGPFRGLSEDESAVDVTTVIHEQFSLLKNVKANEEPIGGFKLVDEELERRGVDTVGVKEAVAAGWDHITTAQQQYSEILDTSRSGCRRSDLTSERSMKLYCSFFDSATLLSQSEVAYIVGGKMGKEGATESRIRLQDRRTQRNGPSKHTFVAKAAKVGVAINSHSDEKSQSPSLFAFDRQQNVPPGFEQINEDLFARKENKFTVLNGAGVDSWQGTHPITKVSGIEDVILQ